MLPRHVRKPARPLIRPSYYLAPIEYYWGPLVDSAVRRSDWREASRILDQLLQSEPPDLGAQRGPQLIETFAFVHQAQSQYLGRAGDTAGASRELARAHQLLGLTPH